MIKDQGQQKGLMLAFLAASSLAFITTFARLMYDAGSTPLTLITLRGGLGLIVMFIVARLICGQTTLPKAAWRATAMCCVGLVMISFGYMMSVAYIPVGLAALIFYTFPLVILAYEAIKARKMPGPKRLATFLFAFAGLGLALGPSFETLNPIGVALAFIGGLGTVVFFLAGAKASETVEPILLAAYANLLLFPLALVIMLTTDTFALPQTSLGWIALCCAGVANLIGVTAQMAAVKFASAGNVALIHNIEPVVSIAFAWFVLGETLSPLQLTGVTLVIIAIFYGTRLTKDI